MCNENNLTLDKILDKIENKIICCDEEQREKFEEYKFTRNLLLELRDIKEQQEFKCGDLVWCITFDENYENYEYQGSIFIATCNDYVLVSPEYYGCENNINKQLCEMCDESIRGASLSIEMFRRCYVVKTEEEAKNYCTLRNELKEAEIEYDWGDNEEYNMDINKDIEKQGD